MAFAIDERDHSVASRTYSHDGLNDRAWVVFVRGESLHAPHIIDLEVSQVLRRYWRARDITAARGREALRDLRDMPMIRHSHEPLIERIWELRNKATAYDAAYIALAEGLNGTLITLDRGMARTAGARAVVEVLG